MMPLLRGGAVQRPFEAWTWGHLPACGAPRVPMWGAPRTHVGRPAYPCGAPRVPMWGAPRIASRGAGDRRAGTPTARLGTIRRATTTPATPTRPGPANTVLSPCCRSSMIHLPRSGPARLLFFFVDALPLAALLVPGAALRDLARGLGQGAASLLDRGGRRSRCGWLGCWLVRRCRPGGVRRGRLRCRGLLAFRRGGFHRRVRGRLGFAACHHRERRTRKHADDLVHGPSVSATRTECKTRTTRCGQAGFSGRARVRSVHPGFVSPAPHAAPRTSPVGARPGRVHAASAAVDRVFVGVDHQPTRPASAHGESGSTKRARGALVRSSSGMLRTGVLPTGGGPPPGRAMGSLSSGHERGRTPRYTDASWPLSGRARSRMPT
jgi:hypothetical protein